MELVPQPLSTLLRRVDREPAQGALFDLPLKKMWQGSAQSIDMSRRFHGERAANMVGPAAGPHTQLAQNIALSYLSGSRILELKTVQILDELQIPRPCIDAQNIGFNVEWSQELKIEQSTVEYAKAALLIAALQRRGFPEQLPESAQDYLLDLSLGYDLKGIQHERITNFVHTMLDAQKVLDQLLDELPPDLAHYRDLQVPKRLISCITLSTFHGCPAHEIEQIAQYLLEVHHVHVVVKLNPTLLGIQDVRSIVRDQLGYDELEVNAKSFEEDLQWNDALAMIARLRQVAHRCGLTFGVKLTNTLVVKNHKSFFPSTEKEMYLSGQPLHVLSTQLLDRLRSALPLTENGAPPVVYSFSAGIDQHNFPNAAAADLCPVTTCTDLLRPGGYARLPKYLTNLEKRMRASGARTAEDHILRAHQEAEPAMKALLEPLAALAAERSEALQPSALGEMAARYAQNQDLSVEEAVRTLGVSEALQTQVAALWVHQAGTHNTTHLARAALEDRRYHKAQNTKVPKKIGSHLELFDCINCDKCIPVCPNDANFSYNVAPIDQPAVRWRLEPSGLQAQPSLPVKIEETHQLATFVDFCNGCGNCDVFCPEDGGPYVIKPHWFQNRQAFEASPELDGFYLESPKVIVGRIEGRWHRLDLRADLARFEDERVELSVRLHPQLSLENHAIKEPPTNAPQTSASHEIDGAHLLVMAALLRGVTSTVNPVSAAFAQLES